MEQKALQIGATVLALVFLLRLGTSTDIGRRELARTLVLFSTGRMLTEPISPSEEPLITPTTAPAAETAPVATQPEPEAIPVFGADQAQVVEVDASWNVDTLGLLRKPLSWNLKSEKPTVLILHTHGTESYEKEPGYQETSAYRTLDKDYNLVSIGDRVAEILEAGGIRVIHDRSLHDYPSYNDAYRNARNAIKTQLSENPSICLVLDLHRDAAEDSKGRQRRTAVQVNGESTAKLMLVMGSDKGSLSYPNWEKNLALAVKLQAQLESTYPGLCRPVQLGRKRYNQDLCTGALLVEVGTAGNTHAEAMNAAKYLAEGILALAKGANI